jgi:hypothetical protein
MGRLTGVLNQEIPASQSFLAIRPVTCLRGDLIVQRRPLAAFRRADRSNVSGNRDEC